jgi:hypothetical protein
MGAGSELSIVFLAASVIVLDASFENKTLLSKGWAPMKSP